MSKQLSDIYHLADDIRLELRVLSQCMIDQDKDEAATHYANIMQITNKIKSTVEAVEEALQ